MTTTPVLPLLSLLGCLPVFAAITIDSPTTEWVAIDYPNPDSADPGDDPQTGTSDGDIVGNADNPSFYTQFDGGGTPGNLTDGEIAFRMRVSGDKNPPGFNSVFWVGIDADLDGSVDIFLGADEDSTVGIYPAGADLNTGPSTTSINVSNPYYEVPAVGGVNYDFQAVTTVLDPTATTLNIDGGTSPSADNNDYFVTFLVPFQELATAIDSLSLPGLDPFDENTPVRYVTATAEQGNALNQDLNGIDGGINDPRTWGDLGGFTDTYTPNGVPEPGVVTLVCAGLGLILRKRR